MNMFYLPPVSGVIAMDMLLDSMLDTSKHDIYLPPIPKSVVRLPSFSISHGSVISMEYYLPLTSENYF